MLTDIPITLPFILYGVSFGVIVLASRQIGQYLTRARLPLISGYLITGMVAGPFVLNLVPESAIRELRFIDQLSLAFIAFAAGSELHLDEMKSRFRSIVSVTTGLVVATFALGTFAVFSLSDSISFMQGLPTSSRIAIALLAGAILVARSPSSAIAIVDELRAQGPFTKTALGVTIVMDGVVIVLFAVNSSLADVLLTQLGFDPFFIILLAGELLASAIVGYIVGRMLDFVISTHLDRLIKTGLILVIGYGVFVFSATLRTVTHENLPFEVLLEPLLMCMIAGFVVINSSNNRDEFLVILEEIGPAVYVVFFTLTGASLALDTLLKTWTLTIALFGARLLGIFLGSFSGGIVAGDSMRFNRVSWMAYITQAGVGIGLAKEVAVEFPQWGGAFATTMIAVIVVNQLAGPPFLKWAIRHVGESHLPGERSPDEVRDAVILGIEAQSLALLRELRAHDWQVIMADTDPTHVEQIIPEDVDERLIPAVNEETLSRLITDSTDALVAMLEDDEANLRACEIAYEIGVPRLIVRLEEPSHAEQFVELGAFVVDPASAMVNLLDQFVRAPQGATLLLHRDTAYDTAQVTITDVDVVGNTLRDLRLPNDVVPIMIKRNDHSIVPHGYNRLNYGDQLMLIGSPESLEECTRRFGY